MCFRSDICADDFRYPEPIPLNRHVCDILQDENEIPDNLCIHRDDIVMKDNVEDHYSNTTLRLGILNKGGQGERIYSDKGVAVTLSAYGGGIGAKTGLYLVDKKVRRLTPRECARLDGFPDNFIIHKNRNTAYKQFGNSIVVDVIQYLIFQIVSVLGDSDG